jgi:ubiquinol-cytochrome c reductase cytochrome b subunit
MTKKTTTPPCNYLKHSRFLSYLIPLSPLPKRPSLARKTAISNTTERFPGIGESVKRMMRGGSEMGTLTISRFFVAHVFLIPARIFAVVTSHILLFRKAGAAGPVDEHPLEPKLKPELFYPRQVLMDLSLTGLLIFALGLLSFFAPEQLGPR